MTADQWPSNVLFIFFFTRPYSEDGACVLLWSFHPERALSKEGSLLQKVSLAVDVIAIQWKIQTSLLSSLFCCLLWEWSAQLWAQLGRSFALQVPLALFASGAVSERWGSLSSLSTAEWWGQICTAACCPYPMSCVPGARCWDNEGEWKYITTTQRICFQVWAWCCVFHINKPGYDVFSLSIFLLSYKSSQLVDYYLSTIVVCKLCSILNGCFLSVHHKSVLFFLTTKDAVQGWILQRVCLI